MVAGPPSTPGRRWTQAGCVAWRAAVRYKLGRAHGTFDPTRARRRIAYLGIAVSRHGHPRDPGHPRDRPTRSDESRSRGVRRSTGSGASGVSTGSGVSSRQTKFRRSPAVRETMFRHDSGLRRKDIKMSCAVLSVPYTNLKASRLDQRRSCARALLLYRQSLTASSQPTHNPPAAAHLAGGA